MEQMKIQALVDVLLESDSKELYIESDIEKIKIVRSYDNQVSVKAKPVSMAQAAPVVEETVKVQTNEIKSNLVGIFHFNTTYNVGDKIMVGEKIGYVETLKTKTDVVSDFSGNVYELPISDGDTVEFGQVIMVLN